VATNKEKAVAAAQKFLERGQPDRALAEFARVVQEEPGDTRTWLKMAEIYAKRGQNDQARDIYLRTAEIYVEQEALQKAVAVYKNALKLAPGLAQGHLRLGMIFRRLGQVPDALQQFGLAAAALQKTGRPGEALPALRQIVELAPERVVARIQLAEASSQMGATEDAIRELTRAAEQLKAQGRSDEYVRVCERLLFHQPENFPIARELAAVYIARKNPRLALAKMQAAAKAGPREPQNIQLVALALEQLDPRKAASIWAELAQIHDLAGRSGERDRAVRAALTLAPGDDAVRNLARQWGLQGGAALASSSAPMPMAMAPAAPAPPYRPPPPPPPPMPRRPQPAPAPPPAPPGGDPSVSSVTPRPSQDASLVLSEAEVFVKYGLLDRAADHLRRLVLQQPDNTVATERLADVLAQLGRAAPAPPPPSPSALAKDDPMATFVTPPPASPEALIASGADLAPDDDLLSELEQVDFFVEQSLLDEAHQTLAELAVHFPNHPLLLAKMRQVDYAPLGDLDDPTGLDSHGAVPLDDAAQAQPVGAGGGIPVAVVAGGEKADLSTHGDLGIAYKEMGLYDAAVAEFKQLTADPARKVFALTMIGECFEAQGVLAEAVVRYKEALNTPAVRDAESVQLYYLLGSAFERLGDQSEALYFFEKVAKRDGKFRDVRRKIEALKLPTVRHA
jgi:tetratricopeptide (TPR) repeat protein